MIQFEKEICDFLRIPSIPKKEWNQKDSFKKGVAIVNLSFGQQSYAVASFDVEKDREPRITKVFAQEPFSGIDKVFVVPDYMETDVNDADLDEESKKFAEQLAKEAEEIENDGVDAEIKEPENKYFFDHIHNDDEARAYIDAYNKMNKIRGRVPKTHENLVMRLGVIWAEMQKKANS